MMTEDILTLMKPPFFEPEAMPFSVSGDVLSVPLGPGTDYEFTALGELIRLSACFGQYNLARLYPKARGQYLLGDKIRTIRYGAMEEASQLTMNVRSDISSDRAGAAAADIVNEKGEVLYGFNHTFHILSIPFFETRFSSFRHAGPMEAIPEENLPAVRILNDHSTGNFDMTVAPFSYRHCLGHFPDFPLVAVAFLYKCILEGNIQWLSSGHMKVLRVENVDITVSKAIPVGVSCEVKVSVVQSAKNTFQFINRIFVDEGNDIPHCLLTIEALTSR
ncbi:hypothetical protein [Chitinophaga qingshengii]|uniref:Dehydrogenase (DH) domain-containing protein n=1 Tax=Chitinophaga qingshengii TaxID=1569794 RepID=A0ABR7TSR8_9BACT|nr:hypothetical protein [Chitinophaga qingshengii]MBC9932695.1 hypothetical protein [Chitinophaga qingshengii]